MKKIRLPLLLFVVSLVSSPIAVAAQDEPSPASPANSQILRSLVEQMRAGVGQVTPLEVLTECNGGTISCGQTVSGRVYLDSCYASSSGVYAVGYLFNGSLGQRIHL